MKINHGGTEITEIKLRVLRVLRVSVVNDFRRRGVEGILPGNQCIIAAPAFPSFGFFSRNRNGIMATNIKAIKKNVSL